MQSLKNILSSTLHLFYPNQCNGCGSDLITGNNLLCITCIHNLPLTNFAALPNNPIEKIFWGRLPITSAFAEFYFEKESLIQHLVHQLKYKNNTAIGLYLGEMMGKSMKESNRFNDVDALIPVPLYPDKERKRGYNQATVICEGIAKATDIKIEKSNVIRQKFTETQTRKHRTERWENVSESFTVKNATALQGKHVLLVDDVITTGATIEACGAILQQIPNIKLSIATLALAAK